MRFREVQRGDLSDLQMTIVARGDNDLTEFERAASQFTQSRIEYWAAGRSRGRR